MSSLFVPEDGRKNLKNLLDLDVHKFSDDVLVFGAGNFIFALQNFDSLPVILKKRPDDIHNFCLYDGGLYDTSLDMKIRYTVTDQVIAERGNIIQDLVVEDGALLDCSGASKIYNSFSGDVFCDLDGDSWDGIFCMGVVDDELYCSFGGIMKGSQYIYRAKDKKQIAPRGDIPRVMCTHKDILYDAGDDKIIYQTLTSTGVSRRHSGISGMCVHQGRLLDTDSHGRIYDTFLDKELYDIGFKIRSMISVPKESLEVKK